MAWHRMGKEGGGADGMGWHGMGNAPDGMGWHGIDEGWASRMMAWDEDNEGGRPGWSKIFLK